MCLFVTSQGVANRKGKASEHSDLTFKVLDPCPLRLVTNLASIESQSRLHADLSA